MFSRYFINRPIFAGVIAILIVVLGFTAVRMLPISQFPKVTPPTVSVSITYPGADAKNHSGYGIGSERSTDCGCS